MQIGIVYPQTEFGNDPNAVRDFAQTAEGLGFSHVLAYDHVLGANSKSPDRPNGPYSSEDPFLSPFLLFSFMAAITRKLQFTTGIIIMPQRQTALVAKQAATLDVISNGRLRLGVGIGWNHVEYKALNKNFSDRGQRVEEQVQLMRQLWTQPLVTFEGKWHFIPDAGLNPLPVQQPIPVWFGGHADAVLQRIARMGDGWMPNHRTAAEAQPSLDKISSYLDEAGRSWDEIGVEAKLKHGNGRPEKWKAILDGWFEIGAKYVSFNTMGSGFETPNKHFEAVRKFADTVDFESYK